MSDLVAALDKAAAHLLDQAMERKEDGKVVNPLPDQVKAFEAAVTWVKTRSGIVPEEPQRSKFDGIRDKFNGETGSNRRSYTKRKDRPIELDPGAGSTVDALDVTAGRPADESGQWKAPDSGLNGADLFS